MIALCALNGLFLIFVLVSVVIEIALNVNDGCAFVAGAGGEVCQGTEQVGDLARGGAFGAFGTFLGFRFEFLADTFLDFVGQFFGRQASIIVICKVFNFEFVGSATQT